MEALNMRHQKILAASLIWAAIALVAVLLLPACKVNVKQGAKEEDKKVDIETPLGGIHVSKEADPRDTGLSVYPGAKLKEKESADDTKSANVNISGPGFGVKVVALEYVCDDPPQKLVDYYKNQLKKFGSVLECHTSSHGGHVAMDHHGGKGNSKPLSCDEHDNGSTVELKVGTESNQHIVAVEPQGKGSNFALVYIQTRGKEDTI
jgi:hypothetical protein